MCCVLSSRFLRFDYRGRSVLSTVCLCLLLLLQSPEAKIRRCPDTCFERNECWPGVTAVARARARSSVSNTEGVVALYDMSTIVQNQRGDNKLDECFLLIFQIFCSLLFYFLLFPALPTVFSYFYISAIPAPEQVGPKVTRFLAS